MTDTKKKAPEKSATTQEAKQVEELRKAYIDHLRYTLAASEMDMTDQHRFIAFSLAIRDRLVKRWVELREQYHNANTRQVYYLSLEFLIGRLLSNNVINLGLEKISRKVLNGKEMDWDHMKDFEVDPGLGNGGLGRLASCFLDSMATMDLPCIGYGLRYDYGIFRQQIVDGAQVEEPDNWARNGNPWEIERAEASVFVQFGGSVVYAEIGGRQTWRWAASERICGVPYDIPVVGYGGKTVNTLRLWQARADNEFNFLDFNRGSYGDAVSNKIFAENLTKVLYPNDAFPHGKELRLRQQYFFVSCTIHDILRRHRSRGNSWAQLPDKVFIQLNDTHPTLVIPELMRILMDEENLGWDEAWKLTTACVGYTNHTILPEALEKWDLDLFARLMPRHLQIIYEINSRFLAQVAAQYPGDQERLARMSIVDDNNNQQRVVRMANLAVVGSSKVNGVAKIHSEILKKSLFRDFADMWPNRFTNMTNGITQRRWLLDANPDLAALITEKIGDKWIRSLTDLHKLEDFVDDETFLRRLGEVKRSNKIRLAETIKNTVGIDVNIDSIFDVQVKRIHEYKRQLMLCLYIIMLYNRLVEHPDADIVPRTFIFAGKAAPGYQTAKLIIRLIHAVSEVIRTNERVSEKLKVIFLPDYRVSLAEKIIPAADVSEQISLAGTEASGTGNMKLMLNGALTLGTMDGANVEIYDEVGKDNIFIFGMTAEEVQARRASYSPWDIYNGDEEIHKALDTIRLNVFSLFSPGLFEPILHNLLDYGDYYMLLADLRDYATKQDVVDAVYRDPLKWQRKALINIARSGKFSSDRTIDEYAKEIWNISPFRG